MSKIEINDTTLRDGEQAAGVAFTLAEKVAFATLMDAIGVQELEIGIPAMGGTEIEAIREIVNLGLKTKLTSWNRALRSDLDASLACGVQRVHISIPVSEIQIAVKFQGNYQLVLTRLKETINYGCDRGLYISVGGEDSSRADMNFLLDVALAAQDWGASRFRFCDTVGILDPLTTYNKVKHLVNELTIPVEMHTHNDFGMATANALAGIQAGAKSVNTTVNGLGERAGNAALEEVVMALKKIYGINTGVSTNRFKEISEFVAQASGCDVPPWKAIVGKNAFTHESGIHGHGVLKNPATYEPFNPEEVGTQRCLVVGKHSGKHLVNNLLQQYGITLSLEEMSSLVDAVRELSIKLKRSLTPEELMNLIPNH
ncbi:homocitrate synthase [Cyanobacterium sp. Dongsha4]|uniref:homocitrate synthase n=1 Tax=Cyanobacterium sp. DS4 TaxID=2878255 RepID=UPI002E806991|nr:homocitrate synthase [Cyanobacterium sp. Dongsha4]WVL00181.1 homocitrate synthase [Cyanobacterium sp. Dongsha4]